MIPRYATQADEAQMMDLCRTLHADNGLFNLDEGMVRKMLYRAFNREGGIIGVIDGENEIAAAIYILLSNFWYSKDTHLEELFSFVRPAYRKSDYARQLLAFAKECQKAIGVPLVIGVLTNQRMEAKVNLYRKKLGKPAGAFFVVGGKWADGCEPYDIDVWVKTHDARGNRRIGPATMTTSPLPVLPLARTG